MKNYLLNLKTGWKKKNLTGYGMREIDLKNPIKICRKSSSFTTVRYYVDVFLEDLEEVAGVVAKKTLEMGHPQKLGL